jgi:glycosyltransferase involved in cell wall biosynthesis
MQVLPTLGMGGAERVVTSLACQLSRDGHSVSVVRLFTPDPVTATACTCANEDQLRAQGIPVRSLGKRPGLDLRVVPRLAAAIADERPDVLHTHTYVLRYVLPALALGRARPIVHTIHSLATRDVDWPGLALHYLTFRMGVAAVAIGEAVAASFRRTYRVAPRRVIPNGIPVSAYAAPANARAELRTRLGISADAPALVTIARLTAPKNHDALVRVVAAPRLQALGVHLILAGEGELRARLEALARDLRVDGRVHFLGERADVPSVLAAGDVFVLPSLWEGNPLAVMEAMAAGKPVVATDVGCVPELVGRGCGTLVPPGDVRALEEALLAEASDPALVRRQGASAMREARERFDVAAMTHAYEALYADLTA